jgi:hypothetical protein
MKILAIVMLLFCLVSCTSHRIVPRPVTTAPAPLATAPAPVATAPVATAPAPVTSATKPVTPASKQNFQLKVKIENGPQLTETINIDIPFASAVQADRGGLFAISGMLLPPQNEKYPLALSIIEWWSKDSNIIHSTRLSLQLGQTKGWGIVSGVVRNYSVTLTPVDDKP